jgi:hypothetical protein
VLGKKKKKETRSWRADGVGARPGAVCVRARKASARDPRP